MLVTGEMSADRAQSTAEHCMFMAWTSLLNRKTSIYLSTVCHTPSKGVVLFSLSPAEDPSRTEETGLLTQPLRERLRPPQPWMREDIPFLGSSITAMNSQ